MQASVALIFTVPMVQVFLNSGGGQMGYTKMPIALAEGARGSDKFGYRAEFLNLVRLAKSAAALEPLKP